MSDFLGLNLKPQDLNSLQVGLRAIIVFVAALIMVRIAIDVSCQNCPPSMSFLGSSSRPCWPGPLMGRRPFGPRSREVSCSSCSIGRFPPLPSGRMRSGCWSKGMPRRWSRTVFARPMPCVRRGYRTRICWKRFGLMAIPAPGKKSRPPRSSAMVRSAWFIEKRIERGCLRCRLHVSGCRLQVSRTHFPITAQAGPKKLFASTRVDLKSVGATRLREIPLWIGKKL